MFIIFIKYFVTACGMILGIILFPEILIVIFDIFEMVILTISEIITYLKNGVKKKMNKPKRFTSRIIIGKRSGKTIATMQDLVDKNNKLEKENNQLKEDYIVQKDYFNDVLHETKQELEQYKKVIYRACEMLEILEHAHREYLTREPMTQEQWKEYLLKDE